MNANSKIALLIGNQDYDKASLQLKNPINDIEAIEETLEGIGFEVELLKDASKREMEDELDDFYKRADGDKHSPYALALSKFIKQKMPIETYFREVGGEVFSSSGQRPMLKNSFYGRFSFGSNGGGGGNDDHNMRGIVKIGNLMYQNNHQFTKKYTWEKAEAYCQGLNLGGYSDWRLPTRVELHKISNITMYGKDDNGWKKWFEKNKHRRLKGVKDSHFVKQEFIDNMTMEYSYFWTSESIDSSVAWVVSFYSGDDDWDGKTGNNYALCVR